MLALFGRFFPIPSFFTIPTVGLDFSDNGLYFIKLNRNKFSLLPTNFTHRVIPQEYLRGGKIVDKEKFIQLLSTVAENNNLKYARVCVPESVVYSFTLSVDAMAIKDIRSSIELVLEENVPLKNNEAVFDFEILAINRRDILVQVSAIAKDVTEDYLDCFLRAKIFPVSFEFESQSLARAILEPNKKGSSLIFNFGSNHSVISIVNNGVVVYSSTFEIAGEDIVKKIANLKNINFKEAYQFLQKKVLIEPVKNKESFIVLSDELEKIKKEINKIVAYWYERRRIYPNSNNIDYIYLSGQYSTILGLDDYLSAQLRLKVVLSNPWQNCLSFEEHIPVLNFEESQGYANAIGLALTDYIHD